MKLLHFAFFAALVSSVSVAPALARGGGGGHGGGGGGARGGGGGGFRGGGGGGFRGGGGGGFRGGGGFSGGVRGGGFAGRGFGGFGGARSGFGYRGGFGYGGYRGYGGWGYGGWGLGLGWGYPYAYGYPYSYGYCDPFYYDCGYPSYDYGYSYAPPYSGPTVINQPAVINQYVPQASAQYVPQSYAQNAQSYPQNARQNYAPSQPAAPVVRSVGTQPFYRTPDFYLIAFTNQTIQMAVSFNATGDTLHYTTREHVEKTAPLSTVDVRFSQQINRDRHVEFKLPPRETLDLRAVAQ